MGLLNTAETWLATIATRKVAVHLIQVAVSWVIAHGAVAFLNAHGAVADQTTVTNYLTAGLTGALTVLRDFVQVKTGWTWLSA